MNTLTDNAAFYDMLQRLLLDAKNRRDASKLRLGAAKMADARFGKLPLAVQDDVNALYREAARACGMLAP